MFASFSTHVLDLLYPPACRNCGHDGVWLCGRCLGAMRPLVISRPAPGIDRLLCLGSYDRSPLLKRVVQELKYNAGRVLAAPLAASLAKAFRQDVARGILIPVPLHPSRQRSRGFNQSELLAQGIARMTKCQVTEAVVRIKKTRPQVTLNEAERFRNVHGAFAVNMTLEFLPEYGIILDDVFTTGATVSEIARVLRAAGMEHITAVTVAKG